MGANMAPGKRINWILGLDLTRYVPTNLYDIVTESTKHYKSYTNLHKRNISIQIKQKAIQEKKFPNPIRLTFFNNPASAYESVEPALSKLSYYI